jgi:hypothetical protein
LTVQFDLGIGKSLGNIISIRPAVASTSDDRYNKVADVIHRPSAADEPLLYWR